VLTLNATLTQLDLGVNVLGEGGVRAIGQALAVNTTLTEVDLRGNSLGDAVAIAPYGYRGTGREGSKASVIVRDSIPFELMGGAPVVSFHVLFCCLL
jgi:hypothetical protein